MKRMQPHRYWHKGVPADLKIVMFLLVMTLMMAVVYLAVDQIFSLVSNEKVYQEGQKIKDERFKDTFTKQPLEEPTQPAVYKTEEQKEDEKNAKEEGKFGYVHPLIIGLFFSIIAITLLGFILYAIMDKIGSQKE
ncbi:MAG TPA: hypothetical protein PLE74_11135 [Candidatus Cloacimonadota bacterium]|nr:hypothetical protein [Candidatus Cloacimonadota bacterium]HPT72819.1 hypothetical protein [Candidatus Cloacimonadota bacterium]